MRRLSGDNWRAFALSQCVFASGVAALTGCATLRGTMAAYDTGPNGIARPQQQLRDAMAAGDYVAALAWREDDDLLRTLNVGMVSYYSAQYARSGAVLDTAALLADDRITASLSRDALSLLTNDMARPYQPRRTERLLIPYYGMLAFASLGGWEDAAVEARRLAGLLTMYAADRDSAEWPLDAALLHLTGAVFERAGNRGEAVVSYRAAHALSQALPDDVAPSASAREGDLLVLVERGYVAHRTTVAVGIHLGDADRDSSSYAAESGRRRRHRDDDVGDYLSIAFPGLRRSPPPRGGAVRVTVDDQPITGAPLVVTVDDASAVDERREQVAATARAIARAGAKRAVTKAIRDKKGETAGTVAEIAGTLLERADVRSWHLLPQELTLVRARLPAGARHVQLRIGGAARVVDLGTINIVAGTVTIAPIRLWRDAPVTAGTVVTPVVAMRGDGCAKSSCR